jgi:hypothetical protein
MKIRHPLWLALALGSCVDDGSTSPPSGADAEPASAAAAASDASPTAPAEAEVAVEPEAPKLPPPDALHVAVEGRCEYMNVSVVGDAAFVAYGGAFVQGGPPQATPVKRDDLVAARIADDGSIAERLPSLADNEVAPELGVYSISGFSGRWPDQLYAELEVGYRDSASTDLARLGPNGWTAVDPFGKAKQGSGDGGAPLDVVHAWYDGSILAASEVGTWGGETRFAVVRGKPKGPKFAAAKAKASCKEPHVHTYLVREEGDVVAGWTCQDERSDGEWITHWPKADLDGKTTRVQGGKVVALAHDGKNGFWVLVAGERSAKLLHGAGGDWSTVELPEKGRATHLAVDREGAPWVVQGTKLHRRDGDAWKTEELPGKGAVEQLVGVELGTPFLRRGGTPAAEPYNMKSGAQIFRRGDSEWTAIAVPPSAFVAGKDVAIDEIVARGPDDVWAEGHYWVRRHGPKGPARAYRVVLHSRPVAHPLRCGEVLDGPLPSAFVRWPTAVNAQCKTRMTVLLHRDKWDDTNDYPKVRKAIKGVEGLDGARLLEVEMGAEKYLVALVATDATAAALHNKMRKIRLQTVEIVCGDQAVLDAAGVKVHRELKLDG